MNLTSEAELITDRAQLEAFQLRELRTLLKQVCATNPFYRERLARAGITPDVRSLAEFVDRTSLTRKQDLIADQAAHPPYGTNLTYPLERYTRFSQTSATTGTPMRWLDTNESWSWMLGNWTRVYEAAGVTSADRIFFAFSFGPFLGFWTAFEAGSRLGALCIPGGGLRSAVRLKVMADTAATVLCCTPTYALRLAEIAREEGIDLAAGPVRTIIVAGEPGGSIPATRDRIESAWGARLIDHHGMTEVGPVTYACPAQTGALHVIEASYLAEVLDADGAEVTPGEEGELVLTTLGRTGSPLLRYLTGDRVRKGDPGPCLCGSCELALPGGILGRTDDMVVVRGVNVYPGAVEDAVRCCEGVAEYRVEVTIIRELPELRILAEPGAGTDPTRLARQIEASLNRTLALRVPVECVAPGSLPRFEMKARRWIRLPELAAN